MISRLFFLKSIFLRFFLVDIIPGSGKNMFIVILFLIKKKRLEKLIVQGKIMGIILNRQDEISDILFWTADFFDINKLKTADFLESAVFFISVTQ